MTASRISSNTFCTTALVANAERAARVRRDEAGSSDRSYSRRVRRSSGGRRRPPPPRSRSTTTGTWSLGASPLRSLRWMLAPVTASANGVRAEDEVDAHALVAREPQLLVVPVGEAVGHERAHDVGEAGCLERGERGALRRRDVGREADDDRRVAVVGVGRRDVEVAHERERQVGVGVRASAACRSRERRRASRACRGSAGRRARGRSARRGSTAGRRRPSTPSARASSGRSGPPRP